MRRGAVRAAVALWVLLVPACGGGGGGGGGPTQPTPMLIFTPAATAGVNSIHLQSSSLSNTTTLVLELRAERVSDLYGLAFDLVYPGTILRFVTAIPGDFLAAGGAQATMQAVETSVGHLVVGQSRLGAVAGASGSGVLLSLQFTAAGTGSGAFTFSQNSVYAATGQPQSGVQWLAGSVQVVQ